MFKLPSVQQVAVHRPVTRTPVQGQSDFQPAQLTDWQAACGDSLGVSNSGVFLEVNLTRSAGSRLAKVDRQPLRVQRAPVQ